MGSSYDEYMDDYEASRTKAEAEGQEPVGWLTENGLFTNVFVRAPVESGAWTPLYTRPAPAKVPDTLTPAEATEYLFREQAKVTTDQVRYMVKGWNACREAMLKSQGGE